MTRQYIAGELSVILGELQAAVPDGSAATAAGRLRREAETAPIAELPSIAARALALADRACWRSLMSGEVSAFAREAAIGAELWGFGVCAGLLEEDPPGGGAPL